MTRRCQVLALSRATYDRWRAAEPVPDPDVDLRVPLQALAMEMPAYGYRRITHELHRRGLAVNHKRVVRLMREDNLLCLRQRGFVRTTDSAPPFVVYPHLLPELPVNGLDQLWVADITYIGYSRSSSTWPSCWMPIVAAASAGRWSGTWRLSWHERPCGWPWRPARLGQAWSIIPIVGCSMPRRPILTC